MYRCQRWSLAAPRRGESQVLASAEVLGAVPPVLSSPPWSVLRVEFPEMPEYEANGLLAVECRLLTQPKRAHYCFCTDERMSLVSAAIVSVDSLNEGILPRPSVIV